MARERKNMLLAIFLTALIYQPVKGCRDISGLGLSNGYVKNYQISASSYIQHDSNNNKPSQARLGIRNSWCGNYFGQANIVDEWLQVDFEKPVIIKAVATQGDPNDVTNFVKSFSLEVSDDGKTFHPINDTAGTKKVFNGNTDNNGIKFNWISNHVTTRYVRFRAAQINRANDGSVCVRLEFYGCQAGTDFRDGKYLYPVGIGNKQIQDGSFSASSQQSGKDAKFARLNDAKSWCASSASNQWLQVDLGNVYTITAITTQGSGDKNSPEFVTSYAVAYSTSSPSSLSNLEDFPGRAVVFKAFPDTSQEPIMNVMPNTITARYLRIMPWSKGSKSTMYCMRIEIYGYRSDCFEDISSRLGYTITSSTLKSGTVRNAYSNSKDSWCANVNDQSQFIKISFGNAMKVSGIAIQGNAQGSDWVKTFKVKYKAPCGVETEITTVFDGSIESSTVTIHWFTSIIKTEYLIISPQTWNNNICLRFQIIGCEAYVKRIPLGMANGYIPKSQLAAFSSDDANSGPEQARLGVNTRWSGGNPGSVFPNDYHQVDFGRVVMLTGIATQGDPGSATDFVKKFYLKVGNSSSSFTDVKGCNANRKEFDGNTNNNGIKYNYFHDPIVTQYVRFHATQLQKSDGTEKVRLRLEYYGMELHGQQAGSKALYPLGMENSIIQNSQLSTNNVGCCPVIEGRLHHRFGWCAGTTNDKWMQITLQKAMTVTAVATQGHGGAGSKDRTYQYYALYSTDSGTTWSYVKDSSNANKLFTGNKDTQRDPVMDYIPFPVKTRYIRINPQTLGTGPNAGSTFCMRVELYGYDAECSDDLTKSDDTMITASTYNQNNYPSMAHVNSPVSWCADSADASPYLLIDLGSPKKITGFGVQGDSNGDNWAKQTKISYGNEQCCLTEMSKVFTANSDRNRAVYNWFSTEIIAQFVKIKVHDKNGNACMRIRILGCDGGIRRASLGLTNGLIRNTELSASSAKSNNVDDQSSQARLKITSSWCAASKLQSEWLQVDFGRTVSLTGIATQGDPHSSPADYVGQFYLERSNDGSSFSEVQYIGGRLLFIGNTDKTTINYNWFNSVLKTRYVRLRPLVITGNQICLRMEYYGTGRNTVLANSKNLYPLGMENEAIPHAKITASTQLANDQSFKGRLNAFGWCPTTGDTTAYLQIDLGAPLLVVAIATQGHSVLGSVDRASEYNLKFSKDGSSTFTDVNKRDSTKQVFVGNVAANNDPVLSFLEIPVKAQVIRVVPTAKGTGAGNWCMRVELYGYHSECSDDITMLKDTRLSASSSKSGTSPYAAMVDSAHCWCASTAATTEYILIDLGEAMRITGVGIQGDSENDNWAKKFKISIGNCSNLITEMTQEYIANKNRFDVTRHWFPSYIYARYIKFRATAFNGAGPVCMRVQVLGCKENLPKKDFSRAPLGMGNGFVSDAQITGTSQFTYSGYDADTWSWNYARLKLTGNRWCSKQPLNYADYVQVDFKEVVTLTGVATQGDDNSASNYVKKYYLEVSYDGTAFTDVSTKSCTREVLTGNTDNTGIVYNWLSNPTKARYVRFRASDVSGTHICARLEFYGSSSSKAGSKSLYTLGMENGVISDSQLTSSTAISTDPASKGRFNFAGGWCALSSDSSPWLQIDLRQPMVLSAIATQGHGGSGATDRTYKYHLKFKYNSSSAFQFAQNKSNGNMLFTGNYKFQNVPVLNLLPTPVTGQFIRIYPTASGLSSTLKCLRAELFGYFPGCTDDFTAQSSTRISSSSSVKGKPPYAAMIDSSIAWCAATTATTEYILIDLGEARRITGVGIQGDSENDNWATKFKISIGNCSNPITEMTQEYIANKNRFDVTRHWFPSYIYARYIKFRATSVNGAGPVCMRVQVVGCKENLPKKDFSRAPLGMGNGFIADAQITGTSKFIYQNYDVDIWKWDKARLKLTGNRWCSKQPLNYADYVEVDFKEVVTLTGVATQGDDGYAGNFVKKYYLQVSYNGTTFTDVTSKCGTREVLTGNTDNTGIVYNWLSNPTKARYVRFRASDVAGAHICARLEFYGSSSSKAGSKALYTLGMESGVITDSQLTSSTAKPPDPPSKGRFRFANSGWCSTSVDTDPWLQIDFQQPMVITAIATQGHGANGATGRTSTYNLKYKKTSSSSLEYAKDKSNGNMLFTGNNKFQSVPVLNLLPVPVTGQIVRIYPTAAGAGATDKCIRAELYGYHPVCYDDLTIVSGLSASSSSQTVRDALVHSKATWCADTSDTNKYIMVDLRSPKMVTGIGIQGDSNSNQWVKTFKLSHSRTNGDFTELSKVFTGNADRNSVVRNWLLPPLFTRYLKIKVDTLELKACMRIQVLGCYKAYDILSKIYSVVVNMRKIEIHWSVVNKVSSTFTLQYRKTEDSSWTDTATSGNTTTFTSLEKYKNYIVRLKSANGILMLKNYVFGGSYSETSTFLFKKDPGIVPKSVTPSNVGSRTFTVGWTLATQTEKDDWDIKGVQIQYKCLNDPNSADCISSTRIDHNITDLAVHTYDPPNIKPWTNYTVKLQFYNGGGRGLFSTPITIVTKEEAPSDAPVIQSSIIHERNIDIVMTGYPKEKANGKLLGYRVSVRCIQTSVTRDCSSTAWKNKTVSDTSKLTISVNGLISWTKYEVLISVYNAAGASPGGRLITTTPEIAPSKAPTALSAEVKSSSTIDITWTQLKKNDTNGVITKYIAEVVRLDNSQKQTLDAISNLGSITASGLKAYANYSIKVAAVNMIGTGPFSATIIKETMEAVPGAAPTVGNIMASKFFAEIQITNIDKEQENGVILGYKLEYACVNDPLYRLCSNIAAKQATIIGKATGSVKLSSLMSWTKYKVKILVFNKAGDGPYSPEKDFFTKQEVPRLPPRNIILSTTGSRSLLLSWDHLSKNDTNGIIINYSVCTQKQGASTPICVNVSDTDNSYTANGLKPYSNYTLTIAAINSAGFGPYNSGITKQTNEEAPAAAPTIQTFSTGKFDATVTIMNINKNDANGKLLGYYVGYECVNNGANSRDCPVNSKKNVTKHGYPKSTISVLNLMSWTKYKITVQVFNSAGGSQKSTAMEELTKEDNPSTAPPSIIVGNTGSRVVTVSWQVVPKDNTNGPIIGYEVKLEYFRRGTHTVKVTPTTDLNVNIGNMFPYTIYNVTVRAKNKVGFGPYSEMKSIRTDEDAPSAPTITNTIPQGTTSIEVRWSRPIDPNGIIRHYELKYCLQPTNCSQIRMPGNKTDGIVEKLQTHVNYTFQIRAYTVIYGHWSNNVTEKTIEGIPTKPLSLKVESYEKSLTLTWTEPAKPKGVILYYKVDGTGKKPYNSSFSQTISRTYTCVMIQNSFTKECSTLYSVVDLVPGTDYEFEIAAATSKGLGPRSSKASGSTKVAAAPKPKMQIFTSKEIGTELNLTIYSVTNYYGPIINYQIIIQVMQSNSEKPLTNFPVLLQKSDALAQKLKYFLAKTVSPDKMPFLMSFKPGVALVDALSLELETPGNYLMHFRAVSKRAGAFKDPEVYGNITTYKLERKQMKTLPKPKDKDVGATTIKLDLTITLPKGFVPTFYYVIAVKVIPGKQFKDSASYKPEDLNKYDASNKGKPYIAAVLSKAEYDAMSEKVFEIGTGKSTTFTSARRRRMARAVTENYQNAPLDADSTYRAFVMALASKTSYFATPWIPEVKTKSPPPNPPEPVGPPTGAIVGGIVAAILIIASVIVFVYFKRRRRDNTNGTDYFDKIEEQEMKPKVRDAPPRMAHYSNQTTDVDGLPTEPTSLEVTKSPMYPPFPAKDIVQVVNRKSAQDDAGFDEEFKNLPKGQLFAWTIGKDLSMKPRNRFANIVPYDYNRLKLQTSQDDCDYINASYVVDYFGQRRYIAAQAPVPATIPDFWTMIWQQQITAIVMLTRCVEGNKRKSEEYWPTEGTEEYGNMSVSFMFAEEFPEYVMSTFELKRGNATRTCRHFHYLTWPDHGVPEYPTAILSFRRRLRQFISWEKQGKNPIIVHCSAGVGRTGTFIAIDTLIPLIHKSRIIDAFGYVQLLRLQRPEMVQRLAQYKFIYECLLEAAVCGVTEISAQEYRQRYNNLSNVDAKTGKDGFAREFTSLSFVGIDIPDDDFSAARQASNLHKNRDQTVLPRNTQRVFLPAVDFSDGCNYINATFVDGSHKDQFIATQAPVEKTVGDFWRMVIERGTVAIVSLVEINETIPKHWPEYGEAQYDNGNITVELTSSKNIENDVVHYVFSATDKLFNRSLSEIHYYNFNQWRDHKIAANVTSLVKVVSEVESAQRTSNGSPIVVHCGNGAGRTGTFIAAYIILERLKAEQMVDVFQTVRRIRKTRPQFVENPEQYKLLYEAVGVYLEQFSTYSNF